MTRHDVLIEINRLRGSRKPRSNETWHEYFRRQEAEQLRLYLQKDTDQ